MGAPGIAAAALSAAAVAGSLWAVVARLSGTGVPLALVLLAVLVLVLGALLAAGLAAYAFVRREWAWAVALLALWPVLIPPYLLRLRRSAEEV